MTRERYFDERDYEDGANPDEYYDWAIEDDLPDGTMPIPVVATLHDMFRFMTGDYEPAPEGELEMLD